MKGLIVFLFVVAVQAAEEPQRVPSAVAALLTRLATVPPAEAIALVDGWSGEAHPLLLLARGQARLQLDRPAEAEADLRAAVQRDPGLRAAHRALARCAVAREDWAAACGSAAAGIDPVDADAQQLGFLASVALRAGDWRLATIAAQQGILRFPDDERLRRTELAVLVHAGRAEDARQAAQALLGRFPADAELWRLLAWSARQSGHADEAAAALEAAVLLAPDDAATRRQLAEMQHARGQMIAALGTVRPLIADAATADDGVIVLACRIASDAGAPAEARSWLAQVPEARRTRPQRLLLARLAVQASDLAAADAALDALVAGGERDPSVLLWAADVAERTGSTARCESFYRTALADGGPGSVVAVRLAAFLLRQDRGEAAHTVLAAYLVVHPDDAQAQALLARLALR